MPGSNSSDEPVFAQGDIFSSLFQGFTTFATNLSPGTHTTFVRAAFILIFQTIVANAIFINRQAGMSRSALVALQWVAALLVFLLVVQLPLDKAHFTPPLKAVTLAVSLFAIVILPYQLAARLVPREGQRRVVAGTIYGLLLLLLAIQGCR